MRCLLPLFTLLQAPGAGAAGPAGTADALVAQALAYEHGEGVAKDERKAAAVYCEAARRGSVEAMFNLGWMYANGRGIARDDSLAAFFFSRAAREGNVQAGQMLRFIDADQAVYPACMLPPAPPWQPESSAAAATDDEAYADLPPDKRRIADQVVKAAPQFGIDPRLALAIVAAESNFQPDARSPKDARGVMQLIASTATRFNVKNRLDVEDNLQGGLSYLRWLLAYYEGRVELAVAAYNAGEAAVDRYKGVPPYPETRAYVQRVQRLFPEEWQPYEPSVTGSSTILVRAAQGE
ncbi:MAG: lytic transglycosylase domain-containing protein [Casimicrobiaceae bacterium]